jgi:hypothetical protein
MHHDRRLLVDRGRHVGSLAVQLREAEVDLVANTPRGFVASMAVVHVDARGRAVPPMMDHQVQKMIDTVGPLNPVRDPGNVVNDMLRQVVNKVKMLAQSMSGKINVGFPLARPHFDLAIDLTSPIAPTLIQPLVMKLAYEVWHCQFYSRTFVLMISNGQDKLFRCIEKVKP